MRVKMIPMDAGDLKRYVENRRAVEARELEEMRGEPLDPSTSFRWALDLLVFDEAMNGWPFGRHDPIEEEETARVREDWQRLREAWGRGR